MSKEFIDFNRKSHNIEDIVRCEVRMESVKNAITENIYAILKNGQEVRFAYYTNEKFLENHQKIIRNQKKD